MNTEDIAQVNLRAYLDARKQEDWEKAGVYEYHIWWLGYRIRQNWSGETYLLHVGGDRSLRRRYIDTSLFLIHEERPDEKNHIRKRKTYLGRLLKCVANCLDVGLDYALDYVIKQKRYERRHNRYAYRMMIRIEKRLKKLTEEEPF